MDNDIIRADPTARRYVIVGAIVVTLISLGLLGLGQDYLQQLRDLSKDRPQEALAEIHGVLRMIFLITAVVILLFSIYLIWVGLRVIKVGQVPLPGAKVLWDTKIIRGERAQFKGKLLISVAVLILITSMIGAGLSLMFVSQLEESMKQAMPEITSDIMSTERILIVSRAYTSWPRSFAHNAAMS